MHFEVLVEDYSGRIMVEHVLEKILGPNGLEHSWWTRPYKGLGRLPRDLRDVTDPRKQALLDNLPRVLRGYGRSLQPGSAVLVVVDLDDRDCVEFKRQLVAVLDSCNPAPQALFRIAIEESEAWLLGDRDAVKAAYPKARDSALNSYRQDSICGTWEVLADAVHPGGAKRLEQLAYPAIGGVKCEWADSIGFYMDVDRNRSTSFRVFRDGVRRLAGIIPTP